MRFPVSRAAAAACAALLLGACSRTVADPPAHTFAIGEKISAGHLVYTVFETQWMTRLPNEPTPRIPQNRFFLVRMSVINGGQNDVILPNLSIEDDNGNTYQELNNGDGVPQYAGYLRKVRPAEASHGTIVFDAPPRHYKLRVVDENGELPALIDIPLTFTADPTDLSIPGAKK